MRPSLPLFLLAALLPACATAHPVAGSRLAEVSLYDRSDGRELPLYRHDGRLYAAGEPGHEYQVRVRNRSGGRLLAVTSVDGVNVISGDTAAPDQSGYVIDRRDAVTIQGWRKSLDRIAAFYFTALPDSYAARTGRPDDVGVIGVALFTERDRRPLPYTNGYGDDDRRERDSSARSDGAPSAAPQAKAMEEAPLGTGHGRGEWSAAQVTAFERTSATPDEIISIYYDSWRNLAAHGVLPQARRWAHADPDPFPGRFTPDP